jgi:hypothetical protein
MHECLISAGERTGESKTDAEGEQGIQRIRRHCRPIRYTTATHIASQNWQPAATSSLKKG